MALTGSDYILVLPLAVLGAGGLWSFLFGRCFPRATPWVITLAAMAPVVTAWRIYGDVMEGNPLYVRFTQILPPVGLSLYADGLGLFMFILVGFAGLLITLYSFGYESEDPKKYRFYAFLLFAMLGLAGVAIAGDLFTFFLFFEIMSLSIMGVVAQAETPDAYDASMKFLFLTVIASISLFLAVVITYHLKGSVDLVPNGAPMPQSSLAFLAFLGFLIAFGVKAGMVPLHIWLPDAHANAPSPGSALLSGLTVKTGAYGLIRVVYSVFGVVFMEETGWNRIILDMSVVTILVGSAAAIAQVGIKRRLAYSTVTQLGYVLMGVGLLSPVALVGAIYHIFTHCFMKGCLFMCAGSMIHTAKKRRIPDLAGIGLEMPVTMTGFTIAALTMVGVPPLNAFVSKWQLSLGALDKGAPLLVAVLLVSSIMNAAYYFPIVISAFFGKPGSRFVWKDSPWIMLVPLLILAVGCIVFTLAPVNWPLVLAERAARCVMGPGGFTP
ncbi:MAG: proton-conducting transporter membrane subunit [Bacillota bacterium]